MKAGLARLALWLSPPRTVVISDCVHFCGYQYGVGGPHPYEQFARALLKGETIEQATSSFVTSLLRYRPKNLSEALGIRLSRIYPLWWLPWRTRRQVESHDAWVATPREVIDVMTHFCDQGIPEALIAQEAMWHTRALESIRSSGYAPSKFSYIIGRELRGKDRSVYLITDGNHRLAALGALGEKDVRIKSLIGSAVVRSNAGNWPLVRAGLMTRMDALAVFDAYLARSPQC